MYLKVAISALGLVVMLLIWLVWPIMVEPSIGLLIFCVSLFWCRKHWISYFLSHGVLLLFLLPLPYFAVVVGLWAGLVGFACLIWVGATRAKKIRVPAVRLKPRYSKREAQWESEPEVLAINGIPISHRSGIEMVVELGASDIYGD